MQAVLFVLRGGQDEIERFYYAIMILGPQYLGEGKNFQGLTL